MEQDRFLSRVSQWFRTARRGHLGDAALPPISDVALLGGEHAREQSANEPSKAARSGLTLSGRRQRDQTIQALQEGYQQVVGLVESIDHHLQTQDRRSAEMSDALTQLAQTTVRIAEAAGEQSQQLGAIAAQFEAGNDRARRWEQTLLDIPKLADAQREALSAISRELQSSQETDRSMVQTLEGGGRAVTCWGESSLASTEALRELKEAATARDEDLNRLIAAQTKRYTRLFFVTLAMAVAVIAAVIVALLN